LPRGDVPPPAVPPKAPVAGPVAASQVKFPAPAVPQQLPMTLDPVAFQQGVRQNQAEVKWGEWSAEVLKTNGDRYYIHYTGWANSWDEWVGPDRIRMPVATQ
jgi:RNA binding activity-knot of a chromodomain